MKLIHKFLLAGAIATISTSATSWAGGKDGGADRDPVVEEPSVSPDDTVVDGGEVVDGGKPDGGGADGANAGEEPSGEVTILTLDGGAVEKGEVTGEEPGELVDPAVGESGGPEVQRGEDRNLDPDVIFQTTALDGGGSGVAAGKVGFGSDERAAEIDAKPERLNSVKPQKKGPVALVKKGRVFLR